MKLSKAQTIARQILAILAPYCTEIQIAGSVRRQKAEPKDIELVYVSDVTTVQSDLFGAVDEFALIERGIATLLVHEICRRDEGLRRWGPRYKRLIHCESGAAVELFAAQADNWGYILALRTGPHEFNKLWACHPWHGGCLPTEITLRDGHLWRDGRVLETPTEAAFFTAVGLPCWPAEERTPERLQAYLKERSR